MYALIDNARSFSAVSQQAPNDDTFGKRKRKSYDDSTDGEGGGGSMSVINGNGGGGQPRGRKFDKRNEDNNDDEKEYTVTNNSVRILSRKYLLAKTGYKFIDIGITTSLPSRVNIVVGDNNGKEISLSPNMWKSIIEKKSNVMTHLRRGNITGTDFPADIHIENLTLHFGKINNLPILTLETPAIRLALSQATVDNMYKLEHCVNRIVSSLCSITDNVDARLRRLLNVARNAPDPANIAKTIRESDTFDQNDIIDCELLALAFK